MRNILKLGNSTKMMSIKLYSTFDIVSFNNTLGHTNRSVISY